MSVTEPDEFAFRSNPLESMARRHSERVRRGLRAAAQSGFYTAAKAPYGYQKVAVNYREIRRYKLEPDPQDAGTVRRIFEARRQGAKVRNIMEQLNEEGIPSPTGQGRQWTVGQVRRILSNEVYCGTILVRGRTRRTPTPRSGCPTLSLRSSPRTSLTRCNEWTSSRFRTSVSLVATARTNGGKQSTETTR